MKECKEMVTPLLGNIVPSHNDNINDIAAGPV